MVLKGVNLWYQSVGHGQTEWYHVPPTAPIGHLNPSPPGSNLQFRARSVPLHGGGDECYHECDEDALPLPFQDPNYNFINLLFPDEM